MNARQQHELHMELTRAMNPIVQSFPFPGMTFPFRSALVIPGHVEREHDGNYFDADERPFLWTNPDFLGPVMHRHGTRGGTGVGGQPEQGMRQLHVCPYPRRGMDGYGSQRNPSLNIVQQPNFTSIHGSRHPPLVPFVRSVGSSFTPHSIPQPSMQSNPRPTYSTRDAQHHGSAQPSAATTIDRQLRSLLWNDETSALSKWYDETLDVRRAPTRASPQTSQQPSSAPTASIAATGNDGLTLGHDGPSTAEASSLPVNQDGGIAAGKLAAEQATQEPPNANDPTGAEQEKVDASTISAASKSGAPEPRWERSLRKSSVVLGETWDENELETTEQLKQSLESSNHIDTIGKPLKQSVRGKPCRVADVFDGPPKRRRVKGKGTATGAINTGEPPIAVHAQHGRRWNAPADLNLVLGANVPSTFAAAQMPPLTAPTTSNGLQLRFSPDPQHPTQHHPDSPSLTCWILPVEEQSAPPVHEQPFAFSVDESAERVFRHDVRKGEYLRAPSLISPFSERYERDPTRGTCFAGTTRS
jgi:hypothetical protein